MEVFSRVPGYTKIPDAPYQEHMSRLEFKIHFNRTLQRGGG